ncbi:MAG: hypothetical protein WDA41_10425 [Candidatus Neomarinimicrobiota bacterium]
MNEVWVAVWTFANSPLGITMAAGLLVWLLNKVYAKQPLWKQYEGTIIAGIKAAEKAIPDKTENKSARRLDEALKYVLAIVTEREKRLVTENEKAAIVEGIQIMHADLEAKEAL